ncbi:hypothetical protein FSP39_025145 [Pinctada imbricata]|uniref:Uncharacterized protein n=1 Tax=Pinctada imbricata TaxID=66713 RepID=A0AA89BS55_PINIB|nr:hypothetical protein FSP39_025145 [Pinctada imbricata]
MQEVALKCLAHIATGSNWQKHRIVQEDFTTGRGIRTALDSKPKNESILCNAACLTANLAVSDEDQGGLQELLDRLCDILRSDTQNSDLIVNVVRGIANFSKFQQNSSKLMSVLPVIVFKCIKSSKPYIKLHGMRAIMHLLSHRPNDTAKELVRDGAGELLESMSRLPSLMTTVHSALLDQAPCIVRPM